MLQKIVFILLSALTLGSALIVVTQRNLFRAALYLILALGGVAGMFALLSAGFLALVQIFIYAGAIAILIIFAVMLTRRVMNPDLPQVNAQWGASLGLALVLFVLLLATLWPNPINLPDIGIGRFQLGNLQLGGIAWPQADEDAFVAGVQELGQALVDSEQYVVPFEVASVLLLVAMVGAVYIVFPRRQGERRGSVPVGDVGETRTQDEAVAAPVSPNDGVARVDNVVIVEDQE
jgi:NADH:ubiquinone oxidoreductase subunit 6 (subunit J)